MGRNMLNTASYDPSNQNRIHTGPVPQLSMAASQPAKGFPARQQKKNIKVRDMKTATSAGRNNAAIANIQRNVSVGSKSQVKPEAVQYSLNMTQKAASTTAEQLFNIGGGSSAQQVQAMKLANKVIDGIYMSGSQAKLPNSLGKGGLPSQVIEMNENVRELVIDAPV